MPFYWKSTRSGVWPARGIAHYVEDYDFTGGDSWSESVSRMVVEDDGPEDYESLYTDYERFIIPNKKETRGNKAQLSIPKMGHELTEATVGLPEQDVMKITQKNGDSVETWIWRWISSDSPS